MWQRVERVSGYLVLIVDVAANHKTELDEVHVSIGDGRHQARHLAVIVASMNLCAVFQQKCDRFIILCGNGAQHRAKIGVIP